MKILLQYRESKGVGRFLNTLFNSCSLYSLLHIFCRSLIMDLKIFIDTEEVKNIEDKDKIKIVQLYP